jgi:two-component system, NtrC family, sensor kinase
MTSLLPLLDIGAAIISLETLHGDEGVEERVSDSGSGIPPEIRQRICDPFFTTKQSGQHLAICRTIVAQKHAGSIRFESNPGMGTTFFIRLPMRAPGAESGLWGAFAI